MKSVTKIISTRPNIDIMKCIHPGWYWYIENSITDHFDDLVFLMIYYRVKDEIR